MTTNIEFEGTVRSVTKTERHKKDLEMRQGKVVIKNTEGYTIVVTGPMDMVQGYTDSQVIKVRLENTQTTLE